MIDLSPSDWPLLLVSVALAIVYAIWLDYRASKNRDNDDA